MGVKSGKSVLHRPLVLILLALVIAVAGAIGWLYLDYQRFLHTPLALDTEGRNLEVRPGQSLSGLAWQLHEEGLLAHPRYLALLGRISGEAGRIQAGEFHIPAGATPGELLQILTSGRVVQYPVTLIAGWTLQQLRAYLAQQPFLVHTLDGVDDAELMQRLERPGQHPEGWFLPDTYHFPRGTRDIVVLRRALEAMERHLEQSWERRRPDLPLDSPYEALILASIVEKETGIPEERARIAGVFIRRLERGMRLQTDPTVIYGMGDAFDGNIRRRDLRTDTPYNTYTRGGLPPTPIALPSAEAVTAVMHPAAGEALYFVSRGDGSHVFSATLEEHNRAVRRYQLNRP
ncbi:MAG: aminodeoxychorismate lyase [Gammaproteobacteria bacterium]|nr:aminodeoxychorismate lyase [Gammaproteobacteria bacterium]